MVNLNDIVVFIPREMESELIKKIADLLRIRQTNDNIQNIIIVGCPPKKEELEKMPITTISESTISKLAAQLVNLTVQEVETLSQQLAQEFVIPPVVHDMPPIPSDNPKRNNKFAKQNLKRFNQIKQRNKQIFFNRTQHK